MMLMLMLKVTGVFASLVYLALFIQNLAVSSIVSLALLLLATFLASPLAWRMVPRMNLEKQALLLMLSMAANLLGCFGFLSPGTGTSDQLAMQGILVVDSTEKGTEKGSANAP